MSDVKNSDISISTDHISYMFRNCNNNHNITTILSNGRSIISYFNDAKSCNDDFEKISQLMKSRYSMKGTLVAEKFDLLTSKTLINSHLLKFLILPI